MSGADALLSVEGSDEAFPGRSGTVRAVDGVSFEVRRGTIVGLVGESGSGKTTVGPLRRCASSSPPPAASSSTGSTCARCPTPRCEAIAGACRSSSRIPIRASTRACGSSEIIGEAIDTHRLARGAGAARADRGPSRPRRPRARACRAALPARVLRRPAPAHRHRARACRRAGLHRRRRAGLGARRLGPGAGAEPDPGSAAGLRPHDALHRARSLGRRISVRRGRGDVSRPGHGAAARAATVYATPRHPYTQALLSASPVPDPQARAAAASCSGRHPEPAQPALGMRVPHPLPLAVDACAATVPPPRAGRARPPRRLHPQVRSRGAGGRAPDRAVSSRPGLAQLSGLARRQPGRQSPVGRSGRGTQSTEASRR